MAIIAARGVSSGTEGEGDGLGLGEALRWAVEVGDGLELREGVGAIILKVSTLDSKAERYCGYMVGRHPYVMTYAS